MLVMLDFLLLKLLICAPKGKWVFMYLLKEKLGFSLERNSLTESVNCAVLVDVKTAVYTTLK